jgi:hypothetical protein
MRDNMIQANGLIAESYNNGLDWTEEFPMWATYSAFQSFGISSSRSS